MGSQGFSVVLKGYQWFLRVISSSQEFSRDICRAPAGALQISVVLRSSQYSVVLKSSLRFSVVFKSSHGFSGVLKGSQCFSKVV